MSYKLLVIVGPTSSGKSELAVQLARRFNGEIISADSRQVYKGMDLGTGKVKGSWAAFHPERSEGSPTQSRENFIYKGVPHHLIDFISPKKQYSASLFKEQAQKVIADVTARGKLPILCGGTGHWIDAVVYNQQLPDVKPDLKLRARLEKKSADELYRQLKKLDPRRSKSIDRFNKRRLIRALEIVITTSKPVPPLTVIPTESLISNSLAGTSGGIPLTKVYDKTIFKGSLHSSAALVGRDDTRTYKTLWLGINQPQPILYQKIEKRLKQRLKAGMIKEAQKLHRQGVSWKRLMDFGLEYKWCSLYLRKKISRDQMFTQLLLAIRQYSKRQLTWWKRNKEIKWIQKPSAAKPLVKKFLK